MPKLNALGLGNEKIGDVDFADMPDQRGSYAPPLYPGDYRFKLPKLTADMEVWDKLDTEDGVRLNVLLLDAAALTVVQSPGGTRDGESFELRISNQGFNRARKGEPEIRVSDMDYLLRDGLKITTKPKTNADYARALIAASEREFTATVEWTWRCNPKKDIYVDDGQGSTKQVEGQKGCGAKYYQGGASGVQKVYSDPNDASSALVWPERVECSGRDGVPCGASVRAFPQLRNFRS